MSVRKVKILSTVAGAAGLAVIVFSHTSAFAAGLTEIAAIGKPSGHGDNDVMHNARVKTRFAASAPSVDKTKTPGRVYKVELEDLTGTDVIDAKKEKK